MRGVVDPEYPGGAPVHYFAPRQFHPNPRSPGPHCTRNPAARCELQDVLRWSCIALVYSGRAPFFVRSSSRHRRDARGELLQCSRRRTRAYGERPAERRTPHRTARGTVHTGSVAPLQEHRLTGARQHLAVRPAAPADFVRSRAGSDGRGRLRVRQRVLPRSAGCVPSSTSSLILFSSSGA